MSNYIKQMAISRLKNMSYDELMTHSEVYGFSLTSEEGKEIINYLRGLTLDPFQRVEREKMFRDLEQLTNEHTASQARQLFNHMIQQYGIEYLFFD